MMTFVAVDALLTVVTYVNPISLCHLSMFTHLLIAVFVSYIGCCRHSTRLHVLGFRTVFRALKVATETNQMQAPQQHRVVICEIRSQAVVVIVIVELFLCLQSLGIVTVAKSEIVSIRTVKAIR